MTAGRAPLWAALWASLAACRRDPAPRDRDADATDPPVDAAVDVEVEVDPEVATVLLVSWDQAVPAEATWVSWAFEGAQASSPPRPREPGRATVPILGLPAGAEIEPVLHVVVDGVEQVDAAGPASTGALPPDLSDATLVTAAAGARPEPFLLGSVCVGPRAFGPPCYTVLVDGQGRVVWYTLTPEDRFTWQVRVSRAGDTLLVDESTRYSSFGVEPGQVRRLTLDGFVDERVVLEGFGTAFDELDDGGLLFDVEDDGEYRVDRLAPDGTRTTVWRCDAWGHDPLVCSTNTVAYAPERGTAVYAMYNVGAAAEIDVDTGELVTLVGLDGLAFDPADAALGFPHQPHFTAAGTLLASTHGGGDQWAREYALDVDAGVARQVWSVRSPVLALAGGQVQRLPSGHALWQLGVTGVVLELTAEGEEVWRIAWPGRLVGNVTPVADPYALAPW